MIAYAQELRKTLLEPKEIDTYFNAAAGIKKKPAPKTVRHTRKVMLAKLALPGIAAILAIILLLFPSLDKDVKEFGLDFAIGKGEIEKLNIEKTTIYVTDEKNRVNNFVAESIKETETGSKIYNLQSPEAMMPTSEKEWINIKSPRGQFDQETSVLQLINNVEVFYSKGMNIRTDEAVFDFKKSTGHSSQPIIGSGFIGEINAEGFEFNGTDNILIFTGRTKILINEENLK